MKIFKKPYSSQEFNLDPSPCPSDLGHPSGENSGFRRKFITPHLARLSVIMYLPTRSEQGLIEHNLPRVNRPLASLGTAGHHHCVQGAMAFYQPIGHCAPLCTGTLTGKNCNKVGILQDCVCCVTSTIIHLCHVTFATPSKQVHQRCCNRSTLHLFMKFFTIRRFIQPTYKTTSTILCSSTYLCLRTN